jgi:putative nucleotidyltransferase with HDIG domain
MSRSVLIVQPNSQAREKLSRYFKDCGDHVLTAASLKDAGVQLRLTLPDLLLMDITLLGSNWPKSLETLRSRFQHTRLLFTFSSTAGLPRSHYQELIRFRVLTLPFTEERLDMFLEGNLSQREILEPIQKKPRLTFPIRFQISWPYLLLSILFTLAAAYITTRIVFDSAEERYANQLIESGKISAEKMVQEEDLLLENLRLVSNTSGLAAEVTNHEADNIHRLIYPLAVNGQLDYIEILDLSGALVYSLHHIPGASIEDYQTSTGGDFFQSQGPVQAILARQTDKYGDKYAGMLILPWGNSFYVGGPILANGELMGVALVGKPLSSLVQEIRLATLAQTSLYDFQGEVLATTFLENQPLSSDTTNLVLEGSDDSSVTTNKSVTDIAYTEILSTWEVRDGSAIGIMGSSLPQNYLVSTSLITRTQIFVALGGFIGLILLIGFLLSNRLSKPLESLAKAAEEVARGNFLVALEEPGSIEVARLTTAFNDMLKNLENYQADLLEAYDTSLEGWSKALSLRDHDTDEHSQRVVQLTLKMASLLGFSKQEMENIRRGALLHDIGKVGVPDEILRKSEPLSESEWEIMKKHPLFAVDMLQPISFLKGSLEIPLYHHEQWDGGGYPYGLKGDAIPLAARIFAVADVYDALISNRPYRQAWTREQAVDYLLENRGKHFDPEVVDLFIKHFIEGNRL